MQDGHGQDGRAAVRTILGAEAAQGAGGDGRNSNAVYDWRTWQYPFS